MRTEIAKKLSAFFLVFSILLSAAFSVPVYAVTDKEQQQIDDYKNQQEELKKKIEESKKIISELKENKAEKEKYVNELTVQIDNYQAQIDVLNTGIDKLETEKNGIQTKIEELNTEISGIEENIDKNATETANINEEIGVIYDSLKDRLREVYVNGKTSDIQLLFDFDGKQDFSSYLIVMEVSQQLARRDENMVKTLNSDIERLDNLTAEYNRMIDTINIKKDEHQSKVDELSVKETEIINSRSELEDSQSELEDLQNEAYSYISQLDAQSAAKQKLVEKYEAEIRAFENKIDEIVNGASKGDGTIQSGKLIWPLQYHDVYVSSPFGYRSDPATGRTKLHGGTDTCRWSGTYGANVSAAADGTVIIATYMARGYGYYVGIDHGNGVVTIYAHNSELLVSVGQHVKQGQVIAHAGQTGYATGAHVHFEVRINGVRKNPLNYSSLPN